MPAPLIAAGISAVGNILGGIFAGRAQTKALKRARVSLAEGYDKAQEEIVPWREAGQRALTTYEKMLAEGPGAITEDAGYNFELEQGAKARQKYAQATGQRGTGAFAKRISEYSQGLASTRYNDFFNRYQARLANYAGLAQTGYSADTQAANLRVGRGEGIAGYTAGTGQARASAYTGIANSITGGLRDYTTNQYVDWLRKQGVSGDSGVPDLINSGVRF